MYAMRAPHLPCVALALALCPVVVWGCGSDGPVLPPLDAGRPRNETCLALPPPPDAGRVVGKIRMWGAAGSSKTRRVPITRVSSRVSRGA